MPSLKGKVALVTGSAKGLGAAIALALAKAGCIIIVNYLHSEGQAQATLNKIKPYSPDSISLRADVTISSEAKELIGTIVQRFGRIDILINNVGDFLFKPLASTSTKEFESVLSSNLSSVFICTQAALPHMRKNRYGRIISFGSCGCDRILVRKNTTAYYIAKSGVYALSKAIAMEEAGHNITSNIISPGILETSAVKHPVPVGRVGKPEDIINAVLFLLDERSAYISGANIEVAGALVLGAD